VVNGEIIPWKAVSPLDPVDGALAPLLATVDSLRGAWEEALSHASPEEFAEARRRSLRRHAIETGIIERLYDVDWGVTEALVAEGLTREVAEREGGIDDDALATIRSQFDALEFLARAAREGQDLSVFFVRQLHQAITQHQQTYEAHDALGRPCVLPLQHGQWKRQPNHVRRLDGSLLEYTPPEHVDMEMERLVEFYEQTADTHSVVRAAWLHHRFIIVHPFEDGNGRVARALVLLVLLRSNYAPLVVDRTRRGHYLNALDSANDGDLLPLARLFAELEIVALRSELERPVESPALAIGAVGVARAYADRLRSTKFTTDTQRSEAVTELAEAAHERLRDHLEALGHELQEVFSSIDPEARATVASASPPAPEARHWYIQLVRTAKALDFFTNLADGSWWVRLHLVVLNHALRYVVAIQKVGRGETGVLAVTVFAETVPPHEGDDELRALPTPLFTPSSRDSVTLVQSDDMNARWPEISDLVDQTLSAAVDEFGKLLT
jgi:Fic/DOC family